jgi:alpha-D-xyloside xylohydrolase
MQRFILVFCASVALLSSCAVHPVGKERSAVVQEKSNAIAVRIGEGWVTLQICDKEIVHVVYAKEPFAFSPASLDVLPIVPERPRWKFTSDNELSLFTKELCVRVDLRSGRVSFFDSGGRLILAEDARAMTPTVVDGHSTFHVRQEWKSNGDESLYGLGQNQLGLTDIKGYDLDLWQHNGTIFVPFLLSTRGYGILWDNASFSRFGDLRRWEEIPAENLASGNWRATYYSDGHFSSAIARRIEKTIRVEERQDINGTPTRQTDSPLKKLEAGKGGAIWEGNIAPNQDGAYQFRTYSNGGIKVWIDGKLLIDHWRQDWLPWYEVAKVQLQANKRYPIKVEWSREQGTVLQLQWKTPVSASAARNPACTCGAPTSLWSDVGDKIDYYFVYGPKADKIIAGYRQLTGAAPMMPIWAFGLWQSRQRYETARQSLDVVAGFRQRHIPFDNIVQDWQYWPRDKWGSHEFDRARFPDPDAWVKAIHEQHAHLMISVWGKFYTGTKNFRQMLAGGFLYQPNLTQHIVDWLGYPYTFFDAFNPAARALFWAQVKSSLFDRGVDAWWLDATEPDIAPTPTLEAQETLMNPTAMGSPRKVLNAYSIMMGKTFYDNQLAAAPNQRVFILTRSGFASQQRYAEASWSGDTTCTWTAMRKQIAAGIGFCMSGVPYWTMDIGGFTPPAKFASTNFNAADFDEWCELSTRWFEFGTFCPLLRVHGEGHLREMWEFGGDHSPAYQAQLKFDRLRYRLLPYVYSLAGDVTQNGGTMMRGLAMDFPQDERARSITDQYMFGPAFLVSPVTTYRARSREVYMPAGADWYDFWSGRFFAGGQELQADAPLDAMPLFVRAGSIIPLGPELQYTGEKSADPITLLIYTGADAEFSLYEDDGVTNAYEKGEFSRIPMHWDQDARKLTVGKRVGSFAGMLKDRTFNVVFISQNNRTQRTIHYTGRLQNCEVK